MFSKFELAIIEVDVSHVLKTVTLDDKQKKTRESIVEKISSHNKPTPKCFCEEYYRWFNKWDGYIDSKACQEFLEIWGRSNTSA